MYKYIYPLIKWKIKPWLKYYIVKKGEGTPSEIITAASPITLVNSLRKKFIKFIVGGNSIQDGEPSPETQVPIQNVTGNVEVKVENQENIIPTKIDEWEQGTITASNGNLQDSTTRIRTKKFIELKSHKYYGKIQNENYCFLNIMFYNKNNRYLGSYEISVSSINGRTELVLNFPTNVYKIKILIRNKNNTTDIVPSEILAIKPLIVEDYDNYEEQTVTFPLEEGQVLHEGDTIEDKIVQRRKTLELNGTENWQMTTTSRFYIKVNDLKLNLNEGLCSHFKVQALTNKNGITFSYGGSKNIYIYYDEALTASEFKAWLAEKYANGTPVIVEYELAEPIEIPFTEAQRTAKAQIDKLYSYKGTTHISSTNEPSPIFEVQYYMEGE